MQRRQEKRGGKKIKVVWGSPPHQRSTIRRLQQLLLHIFGVVEVEMFVGLLCCRSSALSPYKKAELQKIRLVHILDRRRFFRSGRGKRAEAYGSPAEFFDEC